MGLKVIGINHKSGPVEVREKLNFPACKIPEALARIKLLGKGTESVILSTCNRTEVYLFDSEDAVGQAQLQSFLSEFHGVPQESFGGFLYFHDGEDAVKHLFTVTSSLDSMVVGEAEILGQVKQAYIWALEEKATGKILNTLFQTAFNVAKTVRTVTSIGEQRVSVSSVAVELVEKIFQDFTDKTVMVLGAGETSELTVKHLFDKGIKALIVSNRTFEKAKELADQYGGKSVRFDNFTDYLDRVDIVISSTSAPHYVVEPQPVAVSVKRRHFRPLVFIDLAVPRDVHPDVGKLDSVYLYDIDDLQTVVSQNIDQRQREMEKCQEIINREVEAVLQVMKGWEVAPTIRLLGEKLHAVRKTELDRALQKLATLDPESKNEIAYMTERIVNKILHEPVKHLKHEARNGSAYRLMEALHNLFGLNREG